MHLGTATPWHAVEDRVDWTGPPVPTAGPSEAEEPFMRELPKKMFKGCPL
jgi:hypothetical protein